MYLFNYVYMCKYVHVCAVLPQATKSTEVLELELQMLTI